MAYKITFPEGKKFSGIYLSVRFRDGVGETDSDYLAERFRDKGLTVEKSVAAKPEKPLERMTTAELEAKAAELGIDISGCKTNAERVAAIQGAGRPEPDPDGDPDGPEISE